MTKLTSSARTEDLCSIQVTISSYRLPNWIASLEMGPRVKPEDDNTSRPPALLAPVSSSASASVIRSISSSSARVRS